MDFDDFDPTEGITREQLDNFDEGTWEEDLHAGLEDIRAERQTQNGEEDEFGNGRCCTWGDDPDFPYSRDEAGERNLTRFMDGKTPDCCE